VRLGEAVTPERLALYIDDLADLSQEQLERALWRARRELRFFPKIAELRELAGASAEETQAAEAHKAWDLLLDFVDTWIHADVEGRYGPEQGCRRFPPPKLEQCILDCVRRLGGWKRLKTASEQDVPFLKKDFLEEYSSWEAVDAIDASHMLTAVAPKLQLKSMDPGRPKPQTVPQQTAVPTKPKPVVEPFTLLQVADRREMLRQQAELIKAKYATKPNSPNQTLSDSGYTPIA